MELPCYTFARLKPLRKHFWCSKSSFEPKPGGKYVTNIFLAVSNRGDSNSSDGSNGSSGKSKHSKAKNPGRSRAVVELPEVFYRFTDASGNSASVIEKDGTVTRISIVVPTVINPLASFEERDIDPTSSEPVVPISILAPSRAAPASVLKTRDGGGGGGDIGGVSGGDGASSGSQGTVYGSTAANVLGSGDATAGMDGNVTIGEGTAAAAAGPYPDGSGGDADDAAAAASDSAATDRRNTTSTDSTDAEDSELLWDPALLGALALAAAAVSVGVFAAMAAAADAAAASAAAAAAALAAPPAPAPVKWVQLNPVPGMAPATAAAVQWYLLTWTEFCNGFMEPLSRAFQKWSYAALPVKIAVVLVSSFPLVLVFGVLYYLAVGGRPAGQSFTEALIKIHCILNRMPGTNMVRENNAVSFLVVNAAFFTGLFTFAIFLGIVSDEVKTTFRSIKTGDYPVRVRDHVLVLNWSHHTIPLLRQYDLARQYAGNDAFFRRPLVLLSDTPKQDMDNEIAERLKSNSLEVVTRSGSPAMLRDLSTVAAASAHTIIVLHPGGAASHASAEAAKASTAMALAALTASEAAAAATRGKELAAAQQLTCVGGDLPGFISQPFQALSSSLGLTRHPTHGSVGQRLPRVLFQMPDEVVVAQDPVSSFTKSSPANISGTMQALSITDASVIDRFTCQAAVQPGMLRIWASVLQHGPHSIKALMVPVPAQLVGSTFGKARCQYADAVLIGIMRANGTNGNAINGTASSNGGGGTAAAATCFTTTDGGSAGDAAAADAASYSLHMDVRDLDGWELAVGDVLVMFVPARVAGVPQASTATAALFPPAAAAAAERIRRHVGYNAPPKRVIMAGYRWQDVADVAAAFSDSAPDGSQVTFILPHLPSEGEGEGGGSPELPGFSGSCRIRYVDARGPMISLRALHEAGIKTADAVVLRPPIQDMERWCAKKPVTARIREADAMVMAGLIQVQDAVIASGRTDPPHVVARLNRYGSTETALRRHSSNSSSSSSRPYPPRHMYNSYSRYSLSYSCNGELQPQSHHRQLPPIVHNSYSRCSRYSRCRIKSSKTPGDRITSGGDSCHNTDTQTQTVVVGQSNGAHPPPHHCLPGGLTLHLPLMPALHLPGSGGASGGGGGGGGAEAEAPPLPSSSSTGMTANFPAGAAGSPLAHQLQQPPPQQQQQPHGSHGGGGASSPADRIFLADDLIGALLTQVAAQPSYTQLVSQLISKDGAELYLRSPAVFNIAPGERLSFAELTETSRLLRQVALGVVRADGRCCLVPKPHELLDFKPGDQPSCSLPPLDSDPASQGTGRGCTAGVAAGPDGDGWYGRPRLPSPRRRPGRIVHGLGRRGQVTARGIIPSEDYDFQRAHSSALNTVECRTFYITKCKSRTCVQPRIEAN
ncbi:hypothetical protein VOLCADRAFT_98169 [Volvox carteri f. nagariensis]|uniref:CASTOR/POLLUX/SYM8 ion channel conserved domain-containing protein n=1 Tax=Volvox carteri f. nagariensis TaxID=3068 RepID=D8UEM4_VOLCA|nr:uncharacterized protein VOLCADRAFT_98169 [Volvox carteri f. nagariensis]EFJ41792.1 hypothetical protein VOLCADRAFT_98169 [Volvox carteri f. nagariensis]|eukprot:XP_002957138.1 hypothetical protein VOLCADRAFT_98169 [Volvox carteri f. nagariensis]